MKVIKVLVISLILVHALMWGVLGLVSAGAWFLSHASHELLILESLSVLLGFLITAIYFLPSVSTPRPTRRQRKERRGEWMPKVQQ